MFDPLHQWLGIPADEQPPNLYRLLGLSLWEDDSAVIHAAADRQMSRLHQVSGGQHTAEAEDLTNQISAARLCLTSASRKRTYDETLRSELDQIAAVVNPLAHTIPVVPPVPTTPPSPGWLEPTVPAVDHQPAAVATGPTQSAWPVVARPEQGKTSRKQKRKRKQGKTGRRPRGSWGYLHYLGGLGLVASILVVIAAKRGLISLPGVPDTRGEGGPAISNPQAISGRPETAERPDPANATRPGTRPSIGIQPTAPEPMSTVATGIGTSPNEPAASEPQSAMQSEPQSDSLVDLVQPIVSKPADTEADKVPLPSDAELAKSRSLISELYRSQYADAKSSSDKIKLADQMMRDAEATLDDPVGRYALWQFARGIYAGQGKFESALAVVDRADQTYRDVDVLEGKAKTLTASAEAITGPRNASMVAPIVDAARKLADQAASAERFDLAVPLITFIEARFSKRIPSDNRKQLADQKTSLEERAQWLESYRNGLARLQAAPDDPAANSAVGRYLCFGKSDWNAGLRYLAAGIDSPIRDAAQQESESARTLDQSIAVADAWVQAGQSPSLPKAVSGAILRHAHGIYLAGQGSATGLTAKKLEMRLAELAPWAGDADQSMAINVNAGDGKAGLLDGQVRTSPQSRRDLATITGQTLVVGMGGVPDGRGQAEAGLKLSGVRRVVVTGQASHGEMIEVDAYSKTGFVIDYHTGQGYVRRVFLGLGLATAREFTELPVWGKASVPDEVTDIGKAPEYTIDLTRWAPKDWDGECWFSVLMQNAGTDRKLEVAVSW